MNNANGTTNTSSTYGLSSDALRMHLYKNIKTKFYLHKSFDHLSDMEFCPAIDSSDTSPSSQYRSEYFGNNGVHQMHNGYDNTPRNFQASSPRRTPPNLRTRRNVSNNQQQPPAQPSTFPVNYDQSQLMQNRTQYVTRNW